MNAGSGTANADVTATLSSLEPGDDLPLPRRRDERERHGQGCGRDRDHLGGTGRRHRRRDEPHDDVRDADRKRQPQRAADDVVLRVREEHRLRHEDAEPERGHRHEHRERVRAGLRPADRLDLPLPPRRDERRRHEPRLRPDLHASSPRRPSRPAPPARSRPRRRGSTAASTRTARRRPGTSSTARARATARRRRRRTAARARTRTPSPRRSPAWRPGRPTTTAWSRATPPGRASAATRRFTTARPAARADRRRAERRLEHGDADRLGRPARPLDELVLRVRVDHARTGRGPRP